MSHDLPHRRHFLSSRSHFRLVQLFCSIFLSLLLFSTLLGNWAFTASSALASSEPPHPHPVPGSLTLQKFLQQGRQDHVYHGPFLRPKHPTQVPIDTQHGQPADLANLPPSAEPPTMKPITLALSADFQSGAPAAQPLDMVGSDKRLEVQIQPGTFDLSQAKTSSGAAFTGTPTLALSQFYGLFPGQIDLLGSYNLQLTDSQGHPLSGVQLRSPITYRFHYQSQDLARFGLDPGQIFLTFPALIQAARSQHQPIGDLAVHLQNDAKTDMLSGQSHGVGPFDLGSDSQNQSPPTPHLASVSGNSGQLSYSYPLTLAPGPGASVPSLALTYSSQSTNERHSITSPSSSVGEGMSLSVGSISADVYSSQDAGGVATWYSLDGAGVSDRLVPNSQDSTSFLTQHISPLKIKQVTVGGQPCFNVWDASGNEYVFGCTSDSLQYHTDSSGKRTNYRWDLNQVNFANEGPGGAGFPIMTVTYLQDITTSGSYHTVRDAVIKQIVSTNGDGSVAATIDFLYRAPFNNNSNGIAWATAYGNNYNCTAVPNHPVPNPPTTLRCDDPVNFGGSGLNAPAVESTFSLQNIWDHIGSDTTNSNLAYRYDFSYTDHPYWSCWDDWTQNQEYCAGDHLLTSVVPTVYLKGNAFPRKGLSLLYNTGTDEYIDTTHTVPSQPSQYFSAATYWNYLIGYMDTNTAQGASISYQEAYNNTHASPATGDDDRTDPFYCPKHSNDPGYQCTGNFAYPNDRAWTTQVVTQITSSGSDSSAVSSATTNYAYGLRVTSNSCPAYGSDTRCVGDEWMPAGSSDFLNYYQSEFHGFGNVYITSPANDVTAQSYYSNDGWGTSADSFNNYLGGSLYEEKVYQGNSTSGPLLRDTVNTYAGTISGENNSCNGNYSGLYTPCAVLALISLTTFTEGNPGPTPPTLELDNTYDDYANVPGESLGAGYNNLIQQVMKSSNATQLTKKWTYTTDDQTFGGWVFHTVNTVTHSELDDNGAGTVLSCQDTSYDEGSQGSHPANLPAQGLPTTVKTYSDCANQGTTTITTYAGYDGNGSQVASVDGVATSNASLYSGNGCTLSSAPAVFPTTWGKTKYTACTTYDATTALPTSVTNALKQTSSTIYDTGQGALPTSATDANNQQTTLAYSYDSHGNSTVQVSQPGETNGYTTQSVTNSNACPSSIPTSQHLPCYEIDSNSSLYSQAVTHTFYDAQGRSVETRTPGPDAAHDTLVFTVYNDAQHSSFQSVPFEIAHGSGWVDPASAIDPGTSKAPTGTGTFYDALGRPIAMQDPAYPSTGDGITCSATLSGTYTSCTNYSLGSVSGDNNVYATTSSIDPNNHVMVSSADVLGRTVYVQYDSGQSGQTLTANEQKSMQYNALGEPISVVVTDLAPQNSQTIKTVTTTAQYDSLGRLTQLVDPDMGTHKYTYDADGHLLSDVSGPTGQKRKLGYNDDLLGRVGCVQVGTPVINATGACTNGNTPLVQNTYDTTEIGTQGVNDFPVGRLTQSIATTSYPEGGSTTAIEQMQYDTRGRVVMQHLLFTLPAAWNVTSALPTYKMALNYNDANQLTTTTTSTNPAGQGYTTTQVYDGTSGVLDGLSNNGNATANLATLSYNSNALVSSINYLDSQGNALANEQLGYDGDLRLASASAAWQNGNGTFFSQSRSYDGASNVTSLATTLASVPGQNGSGGSETQNFCYDEQNRLVWAGNSGTQPAPGNGTCGSGRLNATGGLAAYSNSFVYTHLGQLWKGPFNGSGTYKYLYCTNGAPHQLTGLFPTGGGANCTNQTGAVYTSSYDAWGNVSGRTVTSTSAILSYDQLDHFVEWTASNPTSSEWYAYDASGTRVLRRSTSGGSTSLTVYAFGLEEHLYDSSGTNKGNTYYYSLAGHLLGELAGAPATTSYFLTDGLGSVIATFSNTAGSAALLGNQLYGPYGTSRYQQGAMGTNKGFTGQYNDSVTGLDYYSSRYYDPVVGVFLSADTVQGNPQGMNPYDYVGGNPETKNDPTGHEPPDGFTQLVQSVLQNPWLVAIAATALSPEGVAVGLILASSIAIMQAPQQPEGPSYPPNGPQPEPAPTPETTPSTDTNGAMCKTGGCDWNMQDQRNVAYYMAQRVEAYRQENNLTNNGGNYGFGLIEVTDSTDSLVPGLSTESNIFQGSNIHPKGTPANFNHVETQTNTWALDWIKNQLQGLQAGSTVNVMMFTQLEPCGYGCQESIPRWAKDLQNAAPSGVTVNLYVWWQNTFTLFKPALPITEPQVEPYFPNQQPPNHYQ